jgi:hypothetical protein
LERNARNKHMIDAGIIENMEEFSFVLHKLTPKHMKYFQGQGVEVEWYCCISPITYCNSNCRHELAWFKGMGKTAKEAIEEATREAKFWGEMKESKYE